MNPVKQLLIKAKARIEDPAHWTTGAYAKDKLNYTCSSQSPYAVCFCSMGAVKRAAFDEGFPFEVKDTALTELEKIMDDIPGFNDREGHAKVLEAFDLAINSLQD